MWIQYISYIIGCGLLFTLGITVSVYITYKRIFKDEVTVVEAMTKTVTMLKEYLLYKLREKASDILETGKVTNVGKTTIITYFKGEDKFKIVIPTKRGVKAIRNITLKSIHDSACGDVFFQWSDDEKLLKLINEYAGPSRDFHGVRGVTPSLLGINQPIVVTYSNGVVKEYDVLDVIDVTLPV